MLNQYQAEINALNERAATLRHEDPQAALPLALEALKLSQSGPLEVSYTAGVAKSLTNLAYAYNRLGNRETALTHALDALALYEEEDELVVDPIIYFVLGSIHMALSDYSEALFYYYQALDMARDNEAYQLQANIFNHIAIVHSRTGDHKEAIEVCERALTLYRQLGNQVGEATIYNNQAMAYFTIKAYDEALLRANRALAFV